MNTHSIFIFYLPANNLGRHTLQVLGSKHDKTAQAWYVRAPMYHTCASPILFNRFRLQTTLPSYPGKKHSRPVCPTEAEGAGTTATQYAILASMLFTLFTQPRRHMSQLRPHCRPLVFTLYLCCLLEHAHTPINSG